MVLKLADSLQAATIVYTYRYFTSLTLLDSLFCHKSILACGTIMISRLQKSIHFKDDKDLRKEGRGSYDKTINWLL